MPPSAYAVPGMFYSHCIVVARGVPHITTERFAALLTGIRSLDPYKSSRKIIPLPKRRHRVANPSSGPSPDRSQSCAFRYHAPNLANCTIFFAASRPFSQPGLSSQVSRSPAPAVATPPDDRDADGKGTGKLSYSDNDPYYVPRPSTWGNKMRARCVDELVIGPPIYCGSWLS